MESFKPLQTVVSERCHLKMLQTESFDTVVIMK